MISSSSARCTTASDRRRFEKLTISGQGYIKSDARPFLGSRGVIALTIPLVKSTGAYDGVDNPGGGTAALLYVNFPDAMITSG